MTKSMIRKSTVLVATIALALLVLLQTASTTVDAAPTPGGLEELTEPVVNGLVNPLTTGIGRGVAGAASSTQQLADLHSDAINEILHMLGGVAANAEQGAGVAIANTGSAVQGTVEAIQHNDGLAGNAVNTLTG